MESADGCIVADAGPLLALSRLDGLRWLADEFGRVLIPQSVWNEATHYPDRADARTLMKQVPADARFHIEADVFDARCEAGTLGSGERAAISMALREPGRVLLDDRDARVIARSLGLPVVGTLGVLVLAKRHKRINHVAPLIRKLQASGYFLHKALVQETLAAVGES